MKIAACALLVQDGRVLLGHRSPDRSYYPDVWDLLGGHAMPGESPEDALVREVEEEIGCVPTEFRLLEVGKEPNPEAHGPGEFHIFLVTAWSGNEPRIANAEHDELRWFHPSEARCLRLADPAYVGLLSSVEALLAGTSARSP